jgi:cell division protein FtsA
MAKSGIVAVLDIGTSKIVCFIAHIDGGGKINVLGIGHQVSQGIRAGIVIDVKKAETSILAAINAAEKMAGETVDEAIINISGSSIGSNIINVETTISGHEVTARDVAHIINKGYEHFNKGEVQIVHCTPIDYAIDDSRGIREPRGMVGESLSTELHVITASSTAVRNLTNCLARCHLGVGDYVTTPNVSGEAVLSEDEKNLGVILLDIGAGNTSIALFSQGNCVYVDTLTVGGGHVSRDIARGFSISEESAERIKVLFGTVITAPGDDREVIDIPLSDLQSDVRHDMSIGLDDKFISKAFLTSIIRPRMEEILEMAKKNLEASGFYNIAGPRVVITGGASQLQGTKELAGFIFNKHARIGRPIDVDGMADSIKGPAFSTAVGMLLFASARISGQDNAVSDSDKDVKTGVVARSVRWFKKNF